MNWPEWIPTREEIEEFAKECKEYLSEIDVKDRLRSLDPKSLAAGASGIFLISLATCYSCQDNQQVPSDTELTQEEQQVLENIAQTVDDNDATASEDITPEPTIEDIIRTTKHPAVVATIIQNNTEGYREEKWARLRKQDRRGIGLFTAQQAALVGICNDNWPYCQEWDERYNIKRAIPAIEAYWQHNRDWLKSTCRWTKHMRRADLDMLAIFAQETPKEEICATAKSTGKRKPNIDQIKRHYVPDFVNKDRPQEHARRSRFRAYADKTADRLAANRQLYKK